MKLLNNPYTKVNMFHNRPRSIYQYSNTAPRLSGQNCKFFKFHLSLNSQKRLEYKENNTKFWSLTRKPRSHVRILIYWTWPITRVPRLPKTSGNFKSSNKRKRIESLAVPALTPWDTLPCNIRTGNYIDIKKLAHIWKQIF